MASNYKELPSNISAKDAKRYSIGIGLVNDFVDSLHQRELLPENFTPLQQPAHPAAQEAFLVNPQVAVREQIQTSLGLTREQVARDPLEINPDTKAYVGSLVNGRDSDGKIVRVLKRLADIEHIYTAEGKRIPRWRLKIGEEGETAENLIRAVEGVTTPDNNKMIVSDSSKNAMRTPKFAKALKSGPKTVNLIMLEVRDLDYARGATQAFGRGIDLGADLCDPRVGPYQRIADKDQKMNDVYWIAMDPINDSGGRPGAFELGRRGDGTCLLGYWALPDSWWNAEDRIVFSLRK